MKKKTLCLLLAGILGMGMAVPAQAEELTGSTAWKAEFDGEGVKSNFTSQQMAEEVSGILPGDSIQLHMQVENSSEVDTDWYLSSEIVKSLEESNGNAQGGAYGYRLWYEDPKGEETILFDSEAIGGDGAEDALKDATESLEEYLYLDTLAEGEGGEVFLLVSLDGETQGNSYQNTLAQLQLNFAVEESIPESVQGEDQVIETTERGEDQVIRRTERVPSSTAYETRQVKTGDPNQLLLLSAIALASGLVLLVLGMQALKKRKEDGKGELKP